MSDIPVVIFNRDRLAALEKLVDQLLLLNYSNIYILDIQSTYPLLLEYYKTCPATIIKVETNIGHKGFWSQGYINRFKDHEFMAITDSDIELSPDTPTGFIEEMVITAKDFRVDKCGLAIKYMDITNQYLKKIIEPIEGSYWRQRLNHRLQVFSAPVDTTFCIVKSNRPFTYQAVRIANWPITHLDWYSDWLKLTEEEQYYMEHTDENISTTKQHFLKFLMSDCYGR